MTIGDSDTGAPDTLNVGTKGRAGTRSADPRRGGVLKSQGLARIFLTEREGGRRILRTDRHGGHRVLLADRQGRDRRPLLAAGDLAEVVDVEILKLLLAVVLAHDCSALVASMGSARGRRGRRCLEHRRHRTFPGTEAHQANTACPAAKYRLGRHEALAPAP